MTNSPQLEALLSGVVSSNGFKKLLANESLVKGLQAASPDIEAFLNQVQIDYKSDANDAATRQLQEWAVIRAIGEIRDLLLLSGASADAIRSDHPEPEDDDTFDD